MEVDSGPWQKLDPVKLRREAEAKGMNILTSAYS